MLPVMIILAIVVALTFVVDAWHKYRNTAPAKAKRKQRQQTAQLKASPGTKAVPVHIK